MKKFLLVITLVALALILVACRTNDDIPSPELAKQKKSEIGTNKEDDNRVTATGDTDNLKAVNYENESGEKFSIITPEAEDLFNKIWKSLKSSQGEFNTLDEKGIVRLREYPELAVERTLEMGDRYIGCYRAEDDSMTDNNLVSYDYSMYLRIDNGDETLAYVVQIDSVPGTAFEELVALILKQ